MALLPPRVVGPLSACSDRVKVKGQLSGATVEVFADGTQVASGTASSGSDSFSLTRSLSEGEVVTARQLVGGSASSETPEPQAVEVQAEPDEIGPVGYKTKLFECGECLWVGGLVPGASVEVRADGDVLGTAETYDGDTRVGLSRPLQASDTLVTQQTACGREGAETPPPEIQHPLGERGRQGTYLPPPKIETPLQGCEKAITVSGLYPGAELSVTRSGGPNFSFCAFAPRIHVWINPPLSEGETVSASQEFTVCEVYGDESEPVHVRPPDEVPRPGIGEPLCEGGTGVILTGLEGGARIRIVVRTTDGAGRPSETTYEGEAPEDGRFVAPIDPLPADATVYAEQELCSRVSDPSRTVSVEDSPAVMETPVVQSPLYDCADTVHVTNLHPGTRVTVYSERLGGQIGAKQVSAEEADIEVAPLLTAGDEITAVARGCGLTSEESAPVEVQELEELRPPRVEKPLYDCEDAVDVREAVPGARVDVYVNGAWRGRATAGKPEVTVPIAGELEPGDEVQARQQLCGQRSDRSKGVEVREFEGEWVQVGGEEKAEILAVHAAVLPDDRIVYFGGDEHHSEEVGEDEYETRLYDVETGEVRHVPGLEADVFCAGHALLEDGSLLIGGGTSGWVQPEGHHHEGHFLGSRESWRFDPDREEWDAVGKLNTQRPSDVGDDVDLTETGGRWYPTLVTLPDGRVLALGGHPLGQDTRHTNTSLELFDPDAERWDLVGSTDYGNVPGAGEAHTRGSHSEYPRLHVLPEETAAGHADESVLSTSTMADGSIETWNPYTDPTDWDQVESGAPDPFYAGNPINHSSVLLALRHDEGFRPRAFLCGGTTPYLLDLGASSPSWTPVSRTLRDHPDPGDRNPERTYLNATLLPTGDVLMIGGAKNPRDDDTAVLAAELYDPDADEWDVLPEANVVRNYHSVALLQPDGAVWTAGSNHDAAAGGDAVREKRIEIFRPWYFCHDRPVVEEAPEEVCHGEAFEIRTRRAGPIDRVAIVRCGSVTHSFNPDQRYVTLEFQRAGDRIETRIPSNPAIAVPGYYLLSVLDDDGVPSEGRYVRICRDESRGVGDLGRFHDELERILRRINAGPRWRRRVRDDIDHLLHDEVAAADPDERRSRRGGELTISALHVGADADDESPTDEYVEFTNVGSRALDLAGWSVEDEAGHTYVFPAGFRLAPGARVRLRSGSGTDTERDLYWGVGGHVWNDTGDTVYVYDNERIEVLRNPY